MVFTAYILDVLTDSVYPARITIADGVFKEIVPIVLKGELVNSYGNEIQKGDWISVKGRISTYSKDVERDGKTFKDKVIEILGFEITDRTNNKVYTSDGQIKELNDKNDEMER